MTPSMTAIFLAAVVDACIVRCWVWTGGTWYLNQLRVFAQSLRYPVRTDCQTEIHQSPESSPIEFKPPQSISWMIFIRRLRVHCGGAAALRVSSLYGLGHLSHVQILSCLRGQL